MTIIGYFNWRCARKGPPNPEKILAIHRTSAMTHNDHNVQEHYRWNLLKEFPLDEEEWKLSLAELSDKYPAPPPGPYDPMAYRL